MIVPSVPWEQIHIGSVAKLPEYDEYGIVLTCINHFSKMVPLVLFCKSDAHTVANSFQAEVINNYILLSIIISDKYLIL